jgi:hypothetical protein
VERTAHVPLPSSLHIKSGFDPLPLLSFAAFGEVDIARNDGAVRDEKEGRDVLDDREYKRALRKQH